MTVKWFSQETCGEVQICHMEICPCVCTHLSLNLSSDFHSYEWVFMWPCKFWGHLVDWKTEKKSYSAYFLSSHLCRLEFYFAKSTTGNAESSCWKEDSCKQMQNWALDCFVLHSSVSITWWTRHWICQKKISFFLKSFPGNIHLTHCNNLVSFRSLDCEQDRTKLRN